MTEIKKGRFLYEHKPWAVRSELVEIEVQEISEIAVKIKYPLSGHIMWMTKAEFITTFKFIEELCQTANVAE